MLPAVLISLTLVLCAPFIGELRRWVNNTFPAHYLWIVNGAVALVGVVVAVAALVRIRDRRLLRFGLIGLAVATAILFTQMTGSSVPAVAAVEHFHFVQYGFITWLFYRAFKPRGDFASLALPIVAAFIFGIGEEWWQWFLPGRVGDLQDVLLNSVAIVCGLMVSIALSPPVWNQRAFGRGVRDATIGAALAVLALAAFTWTVHVGYVIDDAAIGQFRSRYAATTLLALSEERKAHWATNPPLKRRPLAREDQYRSEGETHVRARNDAWDRGDAARAWGENLILEKYFAPVLDTPSHISLKGHRWHPDHRKDAAAKAAALPPRSFVSDAAVVTLWAFSNNK